MQMQFEHVGVAVWAGLSTIALPGHLLIFYVIRSSSHIVPFTKKMTTYEYVLDQQEVKRQRPGYSALGYNLNITGPSKSQEWP
jgi:hypothetical protein